MAKKIKKFKESIQDNLNKEFNEKIDELVKDLKRKHTQLGYLIDTYKTLEKDKSQEWTKIKNDLRSAFDSFKIELIKNKYK